MRTGEPDLAVPRAGVTTGNLVISLDFELAWGMAANALEGYRANVLGARTAIPRLLDLFAAYGVNCTWATVGFLFFDRKEELLEYLPDVRPRYRDTSLDNYARIAGLGRGELADPCHFGLSLIEKIRQHPGQEIAGHTFSHFYCLEPGGSQSAFRADLTSARNAASRLGLELKSLVFPRNQIGPDHLAVCREAGYRAFRGTAKSWLYQSRPRGEEAAWLRAVRRADSYLPISGRQSAVPSTAQGLIDIPASFFLRPVSFSLRRFEALRLERIKACMTYAAAHGKTLHLWWHPHNFGVNTEENLSFLRMILDHYRVLREADKMRSLSMSELAGFATTAVAAVPPRETSREGYGGEVSSPGASASRRAAMTHSGR